MKRRLALLGLVVHVVACGSSTPPTAPVDVPSPAPSGAAPIVSVSTPSFKVDLSVNGSKQGVFSCSGPMSLATSVTNLSSDPLRLSRLTVEFVPALVTPYCVAHSAAIDPSLTTTVPGAATVVVRSFDGAGSLCQGAPGSSGCNWTAIAEVAGDGVAKRDQVAFVAQQVAVDARQKDPVCSVEIPRVATPKDGQVLSGTVDLTVSVVESNYCVMSARTNVKIFSEAGQLVRDVQELDLGERYRWDTRSVANGRYGLTAEQNCCRVPSVPIYVTVQN